MLGNFWFKKEKPLVGLTGMGGGVGSNLVGGGPTEFSASGGTETTPGNGYKYHTFTSTGAATFTVYNGPVDIQLLVVAGGGGAGGYRCSGGGAGGLIYYGTTSSTSTAGASIPVTSGTHSIQVGAGGTGGDPNSSLNGTPSYFGPVVSTGGGAARQGPIGGNGGSGGGWGVDQPGGNPNIDGGTGISGQGFPGGGTNPFTGGGGVCGGGGGAGARGGNTSDARGGHGGDGLQFPDFTGPLIGVPALNPLSGYFAGGGAGAGGPSVHGFSGGSGGAGGGASGNAAGVTNSGGGAASGYPQTATTPKDGGPGIVVVRYQIT